MSTHKLFRLVFIFFAAGVLLFSWTKPSFSDKVDRAYDHLDEAVDLERRGFIQRALERYKQAWDLAGIPEACYRIAAVYDKRLNKDQLAVKYYMEFLKVEENTPLAKRAQRSLDRAKQDITATKKWKKNLSETEFSLAEYIDPIRQELGQSKEKKLEELARQEEMGKKFPTQPTACLACHGGYMGPDVNMEATHPVGRIPTGNLENTVPREVRFYKEGRVVCMSCHDPQIIHFSEGMVGKTYRTLRVATDGGRDMPRFCVLCHREKVSPRVIRRREREERGVEEDYDRDFEPGWEGRGEPEADEGEEDILEYDRR